MRGIFAGIAILTCGILVPINYLYNRAHVQPKKRDALSMLTSERFFMVQLCTKLTFKPSPRR